MQLIASVIFNLKMLGCYCCLDGSLDELMSHSKPSIFSSMTIPDMCIAKEPKKTVGMVASQKLTFEVSSLMTS